MFVENISTEHYSGGLDAEQLALVLLCRFWGGALRRACRAAWRPCRKLLREVHLVDQCPDQIVAQAGPVLDMLLKACQHTSYDVRYHALEVRSGRGRFFFSAAGTA